VARADLLRRGWRIDSFFHSSGLSGQLLMLHGFTHSTRYPAAYMAALQHVLYVEGVLKSTVQLLGTLSAVQPPQEDL
jgi:hypothetical protein